MDELKSNLRVLVDIRKEPMNNSVEGLKTLNEKIPTHKAQPLSSIPPSAIKSKRKNMDVNSQGPEMQVSTGLSTRTRSRSQ